MAEFQHHFARRVVEKGLLSPDRVQEALAITAERPTMRLSDALLLFGFVPFKALRGVLREIHHDYRLGAILVRRGLVRRDQLEDMLEIQEREGGLLGEIAISLAFCTRAQLNDALRLQRTWRTGWRAALRRLAGTGFAEAWRWDPSTAARR